MDEIKDILSKKQFDQPAEIPIIKDFIRKSFKSESKILIQSGQIVITVQSAALAGSLRFKLEELKKLCKTDKRFVIHIGSID